MLPLSEKLKNLMDNFTKEMQSVKDWKLANTRVYAGEELEKQANEKQKTIREKFISLAQGINLDFETTLANSRKQLRLKSYPNLFGSDKAAAELQFRAAVELGVLDEEEMIQGLESALILERYDLISYFMDNCLTEQMKREYSAAMPKIERINNIMIERINAGSLVKEILELDEHKQLAQKFLNEISGICEYFPYPYTIDELKSMPKNIISVAMDKVEFSLNIRDGIKPSLN